MTLGTIFCNRTGWPSTKRSVPFLPLRPTKKQVVLLVGTHYLIDRYRLARYVVWAKNQLAPKTERPPITATGYADDVPSWLSVWLLIKADNTIHALINHIVLGDKP